MTHIYGGCKKKLHLASVCMNHTYIYVYKIYLYLEMNDVGYICLTFGEKENI